ncbi:hypothetical protein [Nocardioides sp.]|uniref:hypothetical protein n=1 Tax=Nocardioides sp. TaxID=35761 RepID=UPI003D1272E9
MVHRPSRRAVSLRRLLALALLQTALFTMIPALAWGGALLLSDRILLPSAAPQPPAAPGVAPAAAPEPRQRALARLSRTWECSASGLPPGVIPAHALVRVAGNLEVTTFDIGWAIHLGERPGRLLAVCAR